MLVHLPSGAVTLTGRAWIPCERSTVCGIVELVAVSACVRTSITGLFVLEPGSEAHGLLDAKCDDRRDNEAERRDRASCIAGFAEQFCTRRRRTGRALNRRCRRQWRRSRSAGFRRCHQQGGHPQHQSGRRSRACNFSGLPLRRGFSRRHPDCDGTNDISAAHAGARSQPDRQQHRRLHPTKSRDTRRRIFSTSNQLRSDGNSGGNQPC